MLLPVPLAAPPFGIDGCIGAPLRAELQHLVKTLSYRRRTVFSNKLVVYRTTLEPKGVGTLPRLESHVAGHGLRNVLDQLATVRGSREVHISPLQLRSERQLVAHFPKPFDLVDLRFRVAHRPAAG